MGRARLSAPCLEILYSRVVHTDNCSAVFWYGSKLVEQFSCCVDFLFGWARLCRLDLDCIFQRWLDGFVWYHPVTEFFTSVWFTLPSPKVSCFNTVWLLLAQVRCGEILGLISPALTLLILSLDAGPLHLSLLQSLQPKSNHLGWLWLAYKTLGKMILGKT